MSTYVLVHGAWHGSWCWKRVRTALHAQGHEVFTPTLTGVGERSHLLTRAVNLNTHIDDVANLIKWEELSDVILCGHSYAGAVISGVADRVPERIRALVYLDAFVLQHGQSLYDVLSSSQREAQLESARRDGDGWKVSPIPAEAFGVNERDRDWVDRQCTAQPLATFQQALKLSGKSDPVKNVTLALATGFSGSPFSQFREVAKAKGWKTHVFTCGHDVMLDAPEELATLLLEAGH